MFIKKVERYHPDSPPPECINSRDIYTRNKKKYIINRHQASTPSVDMWLKSDWNLLPPIAARELARKNEVDYYGIAVWSAPNIMIHPLATCTLLRKLCPHQLLFLVDLAVLSLLYIFRTRLLSALILLQS